MKKYLCALVLCTVATSAQSALINRGGGMIYDTVQNITWLQDANYADTSGFNAGGFFTSQSAAVSWASGLSFGGYDDWRLPFTSQPDPSCSRQTDPGNGFPLKGDLSGCTGSEMGHLMNGDGILRDSSGPFSNVQGHYYWSQTLYAPDTSLAWSNRGLDGAQFTFTANSGEYYAWAVRNGDVAAVPIPAAGWLFGSALGFLGWMRRRQS